MSNKKKKYYLVPADIMESNFPDEFDDGMYPGKELGVIDLNNYNDDVCRQVKDAPELAVAIYTGLNW